MRSELNNSEMYKKGPYETTTATVTSKSSFNEQNNNSARA